jgi:hypothetical protein
MLFCLPEIYPGFVGVRNEVHHIGRMLYEAIGIRGV